MNRCYGASVLDVAPTVLTLYGLPVGEDMDGKVLSQAFVKTPQVDVHSELGRNSRCGWTSSTAYTARSGGGA